MPDQPQQPSSSSPNSDRISSMLSDLSARRGQPQNTPVPRPTVPVRPMTPPPNLPTSQPGSRPAPVPRPVTPPPAPKPQPPPRPNTNISQPVRSITAPTPDDLPGATPVVRPPTPPTPPATPPPPPPMAPKPQAPAPVVPSVPTTPVAPKPAANPQESGYTGELRTMSADIGRISTGQPTVGIKPAPTAPASAGRPTPSIPGAPLPPVPTITIPESAGTGGLFRKLLYGVVFLAIVGIIYAVFSFVFTGEKGPIDSPSPSPSTSATLVPSLKSLSSYFRQTGNGVELKADGTASTDFANALATAQPVSQQALRIPLSGPFTTSLVQFLGAMNIADAPLTDLGSALGSDWTLLAYGQKERFDANGTLVTDGTARPRLVVISEATDVSKANQVMTQWESQSMASHSGSVFGYDSNLDTSHQFSSGTYRQISIRYRNFPYADSSLDWAIVPASNNKSYLVISASRESMFFSIDQLLQ